MQSRTQVIVWQWRCEYLSRDILVVSRTQVIIWQWRCEYLSRDILVVSRTQVIIWQWRCEYLSRDILVVSRAVYRSLSGSGAVSICLETFWSSAVRIHSVSTYLIIETFWSSAEPYTGHRLAVVT